MSEPLAIQIENVSKIYKLYGSQRDQLIHLLGLDRMGIKTKHPVSEHVALDNICLDIPKGQRLGIVGKNGAGKTTLLKLLGGNFSPTKGSIVVNGTVQSLMTSGVGFHPEYTGRENAKASLQYNGLIRDEYEEALEGIIDFCELDEYLDQPIKTYSLGMQSRLQFACATAIKPDILIVDEILGAGDAYFSIKSSARMEKLSRSGCTLLLVSHASQQIMQYCDHAIWIDDGKIRRQGLVRDIVGEYEVYMKTEAEVKLTPAVVERTRGLEKEAVSLKLGLSDDNAKDDIEDKKNRFKSVLSDGQEVFRWPSEKGVKLDTLGIYINDDRVSRFRENSDIDIRIKVRSEVDGDIACKYVVTFFTLDDRRITRFVSETDNFATQKNELRDITIKLKPCLLCEGKYYINFCIIPEESRDVGAPLTRYDLVSRFCDFSVYNILDYRDSPIFFHDAEWVVKPAC